MEVTLDKQGRILIPGILRESAGLVKEMLSLGEILNTRYNNYKYFIENKKYDVIEINQALYDHDVNVLFK